MSYAIEKIREEAAVQGPIEFGREMELSDSAILEKIMKQFNLTEEEAKGYMLQECA